MRIRHATRIRSTTLSHVPASLALHRVVWFGHWTRWQVRVTRPASRIGVRWFGYPVSTVYTFRIASEARAFFSDWERELSPSQP